MLVYVPYGATLVVWPGLFINNLTQELFDLKISNILTLLNWKLDFVLENMGINEEMQEFDLLYFWFYPWASFSTLNGVEMK